MDPKLNEVPKKIKIPKCLYASDEEISEDEEDLLPCPPKDIVTSTVPVEPIQIPVKKPIIKEQQSNKIIRKDFPNKNAKYVCDYCCNSFKTQSAMLKHAYADKCFFKNHEDKLTKEQLQKRDEELRLQLIELGKLHEDELFGHSITPVKRILAKQRSEKEKEKIVKIKEVLDDNDDDVLNNDIDDDIDEIIKEKPIKSIKEKPIKPVKEKPVKPIKEKPVKVPKEKPIKEKQPRQPKEKRNTEIFNPPPPPPQQQQRQQAQQPRFVFKFT